MAHPVKPAIRIAIAVHESVLGNGAAPNLKKFLLRQKNCRLLYIGHPLLYIKESYALSSNYSEYAAGRLILKKTARHWKFPEPVLYVKDFVYTLYWILSSKGSVDIFFGVDNLNALAGLLLKVIGKVHTVVYYGIDYFPTRFTNPVLNTIYHRIDKICVRYCDETWNVSRQMAVAREKNGMVGTRYARQYTVPMGVWHDGIHRGKIPSIRYPHLFYIGTITDFMGLDLAIRAMPDILKRFPGAVLDIVGIGEDKSHLERVTRSLGLGRSIRFHGLIAGGKRRENFFRESAVGIAPFNTEILDEKVKNADPVKLKEYMSYGMPIIVTDAVFNADELRRAKCGVVIRYNRNDYVRAVGRILKNMKIYTGYRTHALAYVRRFDWHVIYTENMRRLLSL